METKLQLWLEEEDAPIGTLLLNGEEVSEISTELGETIVKRFNSHEALIAALKASKIFLIDDNYYQEAKHLITTIETALKLAGKEY